MSALRKTSIFPTSKSKIENVGNYNTRDEIETETIDARRKTFEFFQIVPQEGQKYLTHCPRYFPEVILLCSCD